MDLTGTVFYREIGLSLVKQPIIGYPFTTYMPTMMGIIMVLMIFDVPNRLAACLFPQRCIL